MYMRILFLLRPPIVAEPWHDAKAQEDLMGYERYPDSARGW
jgi:hypothetical protein